MLFCSQQFLLFFAIIFAPLLGAAGRRHRVWLLLAASFYFYACWNQLARPHHLRLHRCSITSIALGMERSTRHLAAQAAPGVEPRGQPRPALLFQIRQLLPRLARRRRCTRPGSTASLPRASTIILPIGISFYTFEAINYTVDVYRRAVRPSGTSPTSCCSSCSSRTWWPGRSSAPRTSCRRSRRRKRWDWPRHAPRARSSS